MFVPLTPLSFLNRAVLLYGRKTGVIDGERRYTYAEMGERARRLARVLGASGVEPGDRVAFLSFNSAPLLEGYFGVPLAGAVLLPINIRLSPGEIAYVLSDSGARMVFVDADLAPVWAAIEGTLMPTPSVVWLGNVPAGRSGQSYETFLAGAPDGDVPIEIDENGVAELFYTSGTTGRPKGVMLTHRNLYLHALSLELAIRGYDGDVHLHTIPLFHVNGWGTPQSLTALGGTHVMVRKFDPGEVLRLIEAERVTRFFAVPTMMTMLLNHPDIETRDLSSLRLVNMGGAPTPPDMIRRAEKALGCVVFAGYGLSETTPVLTFATPKAQAGQIDTETRIRRQASTGMPVIGVDLRVVDDDGNGVARDGVARGEIVVRSNVVMTGYWNDPAATEAVMGDGWFHTGDIATVDEEGYVLIVDRKKDMILSGGENISSVEVEKVLYEHPAILESAVIGVPDEQWGEVPIALVALRPGATASAEEIQEYCRQRIAGFKVPKRVEFVKELPKGGTGKILKSVLREPYWVGEEKRVH